MLAMYRVLNRNGWDRYNQPTCSSIALLVLNRYYSSIAALVLGLGLRLAALVLKRCYAATHRGISALVRMRCVAA
eukprot:1998306-Rhodomonas_salina.2